MSAEFLAIREQILANARFLLSTAPGPGGLSNLASKSVLTDSSPPSTDHIDVVVYGYTGGYNAVVVVNRTPAIQGSPPAATIELAMRKLLAATAELLQVYMPKVGSHQRHIHGGGVFNDDLINKDLIDSKKSNVVADR